MTETLKRWALNAARPMLSKVLDESTLDESLVSLENGALRLRNLALKPDLLSGILGDEDTTPITIERAFIQELWLEVTWTSLWNAPLRLGVNGLIVDVRMKQASHWRQGIKKRLHALDSQLVQAEKDALRVKELQEHGAKALKVHEQRMEATGVEDRASSTQSSASAGPASPVPDATGRAWPGWVLGIMRSLASTFELRAQGIEVRIHSASEDWPVPAPPQPYTLVLHVDNCVVDNAGLRGEDVGVVSAIARATMARKHLRIDGVSVLSVAPAILDERDLLIAGAAASSFAPSNAVESARHHAVATRRRGSFSDSESSITTRSEPWQVQRGTTAVAQGARWLLRPLSMSCHMAVRDRGRPRKPEDLAQLIRDALGAEYDAWVEEVLSSFAQVSANVQEEREYDTFRDDPLGFWSTLWVRQHHDVHGRRADAPNAATEQAQSQWRSTMDAFAHPLLAARRLLGGVAPRASTSASPGEEAASLLPTDGPVVGWVFKYGAMSDATLRLARQFEAIASNARPFPLDMQLSISPVSLELDPTLLYQLQHAAAVTQSFDMVPGPEDAVLAGVLDSVLLSLPSQSGMSAEAIEANRWNIYEELLLRAAEAADEDLLARFLLERAWVQRQRHVQVLSVRHRVSAATQPTTRSLMQRILALFGAGKRTEGEVARELDELARSAGLSVPDAPAIPSMDLSGMSEQNSLPGIGTEVDGVFYRHAPLLSLSAAVEKVQLTLQLHDIAQHPQFDEETSRAAEVQQVIIVLSRIALETSVALPVAVAADSDAMGAAQSTREAMEARLRRAVSASAEAATEPLPEELRAVAVLPEATAPREPPPSFAVTARVCSVAAVTLRGNRGQSEDAEILPLWSILSPQHEVLPDFCTMSWSSRPIDERAGGEFDLQVCKTIVTVDPLLVNSVATVFLDATPIKPASLAFQNIDTEAHDRLATSPAALENMHLYVAQTVTSLPALVGNTAIELPILQLAADGSRVKGPMDLVSLDLGNIHVDCRRPAPGASTIAAALTPGDITMLLAAHLDAETGAVNATHDRVVLARLRPVSMTVNVHETGVAVNITVDGAALTISPGSMFVLKRSNEHWMRALPQAPSPARGAEAGHRAAPPYQVSIPNLYDVYAQTWQTTGLDNLLSASSPPQAVAPTLELQLQVGEITADLTEAGLQLPAHSAKPLQECAHMRACLRGAHMVFHTAWSGMTARLHVTGLFVESVRRPRLQYLLGTYGKLAPMYGYMLALGELRDAETRAAEGLTPTDTLPAVSATVSLGRQATANASEDVELELSFTTAPIWVHMSPDLLGSVAAISRAFGDPLLRQGSQKTDAMPGEDAGLQLEATRSPRRAQGPRSDASTFGDGASVISSMASLPAPRRTAIKAVARIPGIVAVLGRSPPREHAAADASDRALSLPPPASPGDLQSLLLSAATMDDALDRVASDDALQNACKHVLEQHFEPPRDFSGSSSLARLAPMSPSARSHSPLLAFVTEEVVVGVTASLAEARVNACINTVELLDMDAHSPRIGAGVGSRHAAHLFPFILSWGAVDIMSPRSWDDLLQILQGKPSHGLNEHHVLSRPGKRMAGAHIACHVHPQIAGGADVTVAIRRLHLCVQSALLLRAAQLSHAFRAAMAPMASGSAGDGRVKVAASEGMTPAPSLMQQLDGLSGLRIDGTLPLTTLLVTDVAVQLDDDGHANVRIELPIAVASTVPPSSRLAAAHESRRDMDTFPFIAAKSAAALLEAALSIQPRHLPVELRSAADACWKSWFANAPGSGIHASMGAKGLDIIASFPTAPSQRLVQVPQLCGWLHLAPAAGAPRAATEVTAQLACERVVAFVSPVTLGAVMMTAQGVQHASASVSEHIIPQAGPGDHGTEAVLDQTRRDALTIGVPAAAAQVMTPSSAASADELDSQGKLVGRVTCRFDGCAAVIVQEGPVLVRAPLERIHHAPQSIATWNRESAVFAIDADEFDCDVECSLQPRDIRALTTVKLRRLLAEDAMNATKGAIMTVDGPSDGPLMHIALSLVTADNAMPNDRAVLSSCHPALSGALGYADASIHIVPLRARVPACLPEIIRIVSSAASLSQRPRASVAPAAMEGATAQLPRQPVSQAVVPASASVKLFQRRECDVALRVICDVGPVQLFCQCDFGLTATPAVAVVLELHAQCMAAVLPWVAVDAIGDLSVLRVMRVAGPRGSFRRQTDSDTSWPRYLDVARDDVRDMLFLRNVHVSATTASASFDPKRGLQNTAVPSFVGARIASREPVVFLVTASDTVLLQQLAAEIKKAGEAARLGAPPAAQKPGELASSAAQFEPIGSPPAPSALIEELPPAGVEVSHKQAMANARVDPTGVSFEVAILLPKIYLHLQNDLRAADVPVLRATLTDVDLTTRAYHAQNRLLLRVMMGIGIDFYDTAVADYEPLLETCEISLHACKPQPLPSAMAAVGAKMPPTFLDFQNALQLEDAGLHTAWVPQQVHNAAVGLTQPTTHSSSKMLAPADLYIALRVSQLNADISTRLVNGMLDFAAECARAPSWPDVVPASYERKSTLVQNETELVWDIDASTPQPEHDTSQLRSGHNLRAASHVTAAWADPAAVDGARSAQPGGLNVAGPAIAPVIRKSARCFVYCFSKDAWLPAFATMVHGYLSISLGLSAPHAEYFRCPLDGLRAACEPASASDGFAYAPAPCGFMVSLYRAAAIASDCRVKVGSEASAIPPEVLQTASRERCVAMLAFSDAEPFLQVARELQAVGQHAFAVRSLGRTQDTDDSAVSARAVRTWTYVLHAKAGGLSAPATPSARNHQVLAVRRPLQSSPPPETHDYSTVVTAYGQAATIPLHALQPQWRTVQLRSTNAGTLLLPVLPPSKQILGGVRFGDSTAAATVIAESQIVQGASRILIRSNRVFTNRLKVALDVQFLDELFVVLREMVVRPGESASAPLRSASLGYIRVRPSVGEYGDPGCYEYSSPLPLRAADLEGRAVSGQSALSSLLTGPSHASQHGFVLSVHSPHAARCGDGKVLASAAEQTVPRRAAAVGASTGGDERPFYESEPQRKPAIAASRTPGARRGGSALRDWAGPTCQKMDFVCALHVILPQPLRHRAHNSHPLQDAESWQADDTITVVALPRARIENLLPLPIAVKLSAPGGYEYCPALEDASLPPGATKDLLFIPPTTAPHLVASAPGRGAHDANGRGGDIHLSVSVRGSSAHRGWSVLPKKAPLLHFGAATKVGATSLGAKDDVPPCSLLMFEPGPSAATGQSNGFHSLLVERTFVGEDYLRDETLLDAVVQEPRNLRRETALLASAAGAFVIHAPVWFVNTCDFPIVVSSVRNRNASEARLPPRCTDDNPIPCIRLWSQDDTVTKRERNVVFKFDDANASWSDAVDMRALGAQQTVWLPQARAGAPTKPSASTIAWVPVTVQVSPAPRPFDRSDIVRIMPAATFINASRATVQWAVASPAGKGITSMGSLLPNASAAVPYAEKGDTSVTLQLGLCSVLQAPDNASEGVERVQWSPRVRVDDRPQQLLVPQTSVADWMASPRDMVVPLGSHVATRERRAWLLRVAAQDTGQAIYLKEVDRLQAAEAAQFRLRNDCTGYAVHVRLVEDGGYQPLVATAPCYAGWRSQVEPLIVPPADYRGTVREVELQMVPIGVDAILRWDNGVIGRALANGDWEEASSLLAERAIVRDDDIDATFAATMRLTGGAAGLHEILTTDTWANWQSVSEPLYAHNDAFLAEVRMQRGGKLLAIRDAGSASRPSAGDLPATDRFVEYLQRLQHCERLRHVGMELLSRLVRRRFAPGGGRPPVIAEPVRAALLIRIPAASLRALANEVREPALELVLNVFLGGDFVGAVSFALRDAIGSSIPAELHRWFILPASRAQRVRVQCMLRTPLSDASAASAAIPAQGDVALDEVPFDTFINRDVSLTAPQRSEVAVGACALQICVLASVHREQSQLMVAQQMLTDAVNATRALMERLQAAIAEVLLPRALHADGHSRHRIAPLPGSASPRNLRLARSGSNSGVAMLPEDAPCPAALLQLQTQSLQTELAMLAATVKRALTFDGSSAPTTADRGWRHIGHQLEVDFADLDRTVAVVGAALKHAPYNGACQWSVFPAAQVGGTLVCGHPVPTALRASFRMTPMGLIFSELPQHERICLSNVDAPVAFAALGNEQAWVLRLLRQYQWTVLTVNGITIRGSMDASALSVLQQVLDTASHDPPIDLVFIRMPDHRLQRELMLRIPDEVLLNEPVVAAMTAGDANTLVAGPLLEHAVEAPLLTGLYLRASSAPSPAAEAVSTVLTPISRVLRPGDSGGALEGSQCLLAGRTHIPSMQLASTQFYIAPTERNHHRDTDDAEVGIVAEVPLRCQWVPRYVSAAERIACESDIHLEGMALSLLDERPRELVVCTVDRVRANATFDAKSETACTLSVGDICVQNQLPHAAFPCMLARVPTTEDGRMGPGMRPSDARPQPVPSGWKALEASPCILAAVTRRPQAALLHIPHAFLRVAPLQINIDDDLAEALLLWTLSLRVPAALDAMSKRTPAGAAGRAAGLAGPEGILQSALLARSAELADAPAAITSQPLAIEHLNIGAIMAQLSVRVRNAHVLSYLIPSSGPFTVLRRVLETCAVVLGNVDHAPIRLRALELHDEYQPLAAFIQVLGRHYIQSIITQSYKVLGAISVLGNPTGVFGAAADDARILAKQPARAAGEGRATYGMQLATTSTVGLAADIAAATVGGVGGALESTARGLEVLPAPSGRATALRTAPEPRGFREGLSEGGAAFASDVGAGVTGVVSAPVQGAKRGGILGFARGVVAGALGLVAKPTAGAMQFAAMTAQGVAADLSGHAPPTAARSRLPRFIGPSRAVTLYSAREAEGAMRLQDLVQRAHASSSDTYLFHTAVHAYMQASVVPAAASRNGRGTRRGATAGTLDRLQTLGANGTRSSLPTGTPRRERAASEPAMTRSALAPAQFVLLVSAQRVWLLHHSSNRIIWDMPLAANAPEGQTSLRSTGSPPTGMSPWTHGRPAGPPFRLLLSPIIVLLPSGTGGGTGRAALPSQAGQSVLCASPVQASLAAHAIELAKAGCGDARYVTQREEDVLRQVSVGAILAADRAVMNAITRNQVVDGLFKLWQAWPQRVRKVRVNASPGASALLAVHTDMASADGRAPIGFDAEVSLASVEEVAASLPAAWKQQHPVLATFASDGGMNAAGLTPVVQGRAQQAIDVVLTLLREECIRQASFTPSAIEPHLYARISEATRQLLGVQWAC